MMTAKISTQKPTMTLMIPLLVMLVGLAFSGSLSPLQRLLISTIVLFMAFKVAAIVKQSGPTNFAYFFWPGIDPRPFQCARQEPVADGHRFGHGLARLILGFLALGFIAFFSKGLGLNLSTWLAIAAILFAIHFGFSDMLSGLAQAFGWKVKPLFDSPLRTKSLSDFWSRRWNRPFVEMDRLFFLPALSRFGMRFAVVGVFLISGLLHEFAISYPAGAGWGGPIVYFAIQSCMFLVEKRFRIRGSIWTFTVVLAPLPLLFHGPFRQVCVWPLLESVSILLKSIETQVAINYLIISLASAQLLVLLASFQVPTRLRWKEDLPKLGPFNAKLMWTYGAFTVYTIVTWSILTFALRQDMSTGTPAGLAVALAIFLFWAARIATDAFYFKSDDWPKGPFMQIGHAMLNALFAFLCCGYGSIVVWGVVS